MEISLLEHGRRGDWSGGPIDGWVPSQWLAEGSWREEFATAFKDWVHVVGWVLDWVGLSQVELEASCG